MTEIKNYIKAEFGSIAAFAKIVGIHRVTLFNYLNGKRMPRKSLALKMVQTTNSAITLADIYALSTSTTGGVDGESEPQDVDNIAESGKDSERSEE